VQPGGRPPLEVLIKIAVENLIVQYHPAFVR
jgi:hypothetical protein